MADYTNKELLKLTSKQREEYANRLLSKSTAFSYSDEDAKERRCACPRFLKKHSDIPNYHPPISDEWARCQACNKPRNRWSGKYCRQCWLISLKIHREEKMQEWYAYQNRAEHFLSLPLAQRQIDGGKQRGDKNFTYMEPITESEDYL